MTTPEWLKFLESARASSYHMAKIVWNRRGSFDGQLARLINITMAQKVTRQWGTLKITLWTLVNSNPEKRGLCSV